MNVHPHAALVRMTTDPTAHRQAETSARRLVEAAPRTLHVDHVVVESFSEAPILRDNHAAIFICALRDLAIG